MLNSTVIKIFQRFTMFTVLVVWSWFNWFSTAYHDGELIDKSGFSTKYGKAFNWHPFLMVLSLVGLNFTASALFFRYSKSCKSKNTIKNIHISFHCMALVLAFIGIIPVQQSHSIESYSVHNVFGHIVLLIYTLQFLFAILSYTDNFLCRCSNNFREMTIMSHKKVGLSLTILVLLSAVTGIAEILEHHKSCNALVDDKRLLHEGHEEIEGKIMFDCKIGIFSAILLTFVTIFLIFLLVEVPSKIKSNNSFEPINIEDIELERFTNVFEEEIELA